MRLTPPPQHESLQLLEEFCCGCSICQADLPFAVPFTLLSSPPLTSQFLFSATFLISQASTRCSLLVRPLSLPLCLCLSPSQSPLPMLLYFVPPPFPPPLIPSRHTRSLHTLSTLTLILYLFLYAASAAASSHSLPLSVSV